MPLESDSKVEVVVDAEDAPEEDGPLGDDDGDEHGECDGREAVSPQEGHQEAEPAKQHHVNVQRRCKVDKSGWKPGNTTNLKSGEDMLSLSVEFTYIYRPLHLRLRRPIRKSSGASENHLR